MLLAACIVFNMIVGYHSLCFGMYYVKITETFETSKAAAGFISSLHGAIGPLSGILLSLYLICTVLCWLHWLHMNQKYFSHQGSFLARFYSYFNNIHKVHKCTC